MFIVSWIKDHLDQFYQAHFKQWVDENWIRIQPYLKGAKFVILHGLVVFLIASVCLYVSAFLFGALYFYNMPTIYHTFDLNLHYNRQCIELHRSFQRHGVGGENLYQDLCFPKALVDLGSPNNGRLLQLDQSYRFSLKLVMPESRPNLDIGMFMVRIKSGKMHSATSTSLRYRPFIIRVASMLLFWPLLISDIMDDTQTLNIALFENIRLSKPDSVDKSTCQRYHLEDFYKNINCDHWMAEISIDYPDIQVYSTQLQVTATFSGLQYLLFQWPVFSFFVGTSLFFIPVLSLVLVFFYLVLFKPYKDIWRTLTGTGNDVVRTSQRRNNCRRNVEEEPSELTLEEENDDAEATESTSSSSIEMLGNLGDRDQTNDNFQEGEEEDNEESSLRRRNVSSDAT